MDSVITLVGQIFTESEIGEQIATEVEQTVFCSIDSVSGSEWDRAGRNDIQAIYRAVMPRCNYHGERIVKYNCTRYGVYRIYYPDDSDDVELYIESKAGVGS